MGETPRRAIDRSDQLARAALAEALTRFPRWRDDVARFAISVEKAKRTGDKAPILGRCEEIAREIAEVRTELILNLAEAPPRVCGHSRVVDIEKALDNIEATLSQVRTQLEAVNRQH